MMKLRKAQRTFKLKEYGMRLWTREKARKVREELQELLLASEAGAVTEIDCSTVEVFDVSFAAEFFCKSLLRLPTEFPDRFLIISGLNEYTRTNLDAALKDIGLMALERDEAGLRLIGKFMSSARETLDTLTKRREPVSAAELADLLDINVTAANERLVKLSKRSIIRRRQPEKGRSQVYLPVA